MLDLPAKFHDYVCRSDEWILYYKILSKSGYELCRVYKLNNEFEMDFVDRAKAIADVLNFPLKYFNEFCAPPAKNDH